MPSAGGAASSGLVRAPTNRPNKKLKLPILEPLANPAAEKNEQDEKGKESGHGASFRRKGPPGEETPRAGPD